ncbi:MAG TPA: RidA family protein, partial [Kiloniellales bacterium]
EKAAGKPAGEQMADILGRIDGLLAEAGTDKRYLLSATIWLADMRDYDAINTAWDAWLPEGCAPARACVEAKLAFAKYTVEVWVIAAR